MNRYVFCMLLILLSFPIFSQTGTNGITVYEDPRIQSYVNKYNSLYQVKKSNVIYRIQLISTYSRDEANRTQGRFRNLFPNESSFLTYDGVKFLVRAGSFETKSDAEVMLIDLRRNFPASFILPPERKKN